MLCGVHCMAGECRRKRRRHSHTRNVFDVLAHYALYFIGRLCRQVILFIFYMFFALCVYANCGEPSARHRPFQIYMPRTRFADGTEANFYFSSFSVVISFYLFAVNRMASAFSVIKKYCLDVLRWLRSYGRLGKMAENSAIRITSTVVVASINTLCSTSQVPN